MEITTTTTDQPKPARSAVVSAFALVGFIALIIIGILLAIYSAKYIPKTVSRIGGAAVSLSQIFKPHGSAPSLQVVAATSTLAIGDTMSSTSDATSTDATTTATTTIVATKPHTSAGVTMTTPVVTGPAPLSGLPDLTVAITDIGYLNSAGNDSFISSSNVPSGKNGAVKFTVMNIGTNVAGPFTFTANIPTSPSFTYTSPVQQTLNPGDRIEYTLGFDRGDTGTARTITILVDNANVVNESNELNNSEARAIDINN